MYTQNQQVEQFGSIYVVERIYSLADEEMRLNNLIHRKRVTLRKISGVNGLDVYDFALPAEGA
jgi:hypothetical protein